MCPKGDLEEGGDNDTRKAPPAHRASSVLHHSTDPFAYREGKTLVWRNVNMTLVCTHEY